MRGGSAVSAAFALAALLAGSTGSSAQGVTVALTPNGEQVAPGATFDLAITVMTAGSPFNGFDAVIGYDPAALTFVSLSPISLQEGALMTGACGNRFHVFRAGTSSDTVTDVLLCNGASLSGPGQVYRLRFRASTTPQVTLVKFLPGLQFYQAGLYVNPVRSADAAVGIGMPVALDVASSPRSGPLHMRIAPNPARDGAVFTLDADHPGRQNVSVFDIRGRLVRTFDDSVTTVGVRTLTWDGRDDAGRPLPTGVYLVKFDAAGRSVSNRVSLIR